MNREAASIKNTIYGILKNHHIRTGKKPVILQIGKREKAVIDLEFSAVVVHDEIKTGDSYTVGIYPVKIEIVDIDSIVGVK